MNQNTNVNLIPKFPFSGNLYFSQYDVGRVATINLVEDGTAYTIPSGATVKIQATKPSGLGFSVDCTYSGNVVTVVSTETMTDEYGRFPCELRIESGDVLLGTTNFTFNVEKSPHLDGTTDGTAESVVSEITVALQNALTDLQAESAAQQDAIQAKGETTLASIPDDYTSLAQEVSELQDAVGTETETLINNSLSVGSGPVATTRRWFVDGIIPANAHISTVKYFCASATSGTLDIELWSRSGSTLTRVKAQTETPTASSINTAVIDFDTTEDTMISFKASASNLRSDSTADGYKTYACADLSSTSVSTSSLEAFNRMLLCVTLDYAVMPSESITTSLGKLTSAVSKTLVDHSNSLGTGGVATTRRWFVDGSVPKGGLITSIDYFCASATSGTLDIEFWSKSGNTLTRSAIKTVTPLPSRINTVKINLLATEETMISFKSSDTNIRSDSNASAKTFASADLSSTSLTYSSLETLTLSLCATISYVYDGIVEETENRYFVIDVNGGGDYTSFSQAVIDSFTKYPNATLLLKAGTYDVYQEMIDIYGSDYWDTLTADTAGLAKYYMGLPLGNGVKIIGTLGAVVKMENLSSNSVVSTWFSGFYGMHNFDSKYQGAEVYNLKMVCKKIRYAIHLDFGVAPRTDYYRIENCELYLDNSTNADRDNAYVLGCGGGMYTTYDFIKNYLYPTFPISPRDMAGIYYHNSGADSPQNRCNISENYVDNGGTIRTDPNGTSTNNCLVFISNNNIGSAMMLNGQSGTNLKIVDWNNHIRN